MRRFVSAVVLVAVCLLVSGCGSEPAQVKEKDQIAPKGRIPAVEDKSKKK